MGTASIILAFQIIEDNVAVLLMNLGIVDRSASIHAKNDSAFKKKYSKAKAAGYSLQAALAMGSSKDIDTYRKIYDKYQKASEIFWALAEKVVKVEKYLEEGELIDPAELI